MIFQLGIKKQKKFVKMNKHIQNNDMFLAALEMKKQLMVQTNTKKSGWINKSSFKKEYEKKR